MNEQILLYNSTHKDAVNVFIEQARKEESAGTFREDKFNVDTLDPKSSLWFALVDNVVVSVSYAQRSFITGTPTSIRICRYHILKKYRHGRYGFKMLEKQVAWAKENGFKHFYWTHDINNKALNALYQHKKRYLHGDNTFFETGYFKQLMLEPNILFHDSPKSNMLQYVYSIYLDTDFVWEPKSNIIKYIHNGDIKISSMEILNAENIIRNN